MWDDSSLWFYLHFPDNQWCWTSFPGSVGYIHVFFGKISIYILSPFLNEVVWEGFLMPLSCLNCSYILDINFLSDMICKYFHYSLGCLFIVLMVSYAVRTLLVLWRPHMIIFALVALAFGVKSENSTLGLMSRSLLLLSISF